MLGVSFLLHTICLSVCVHLQNASGYCLLSEDTLQVLLFSSFYRFCLLWWPVSSLLEPGVRVVLCQQTARVASFQRGRQPQPRQGSNLSSKGTVPPYCAQQHRAGVMTLKGSFNCPATIRQMQSDKSDPKTSEAGTAGERTRHKPADNRAQARPGMEPAFLILVVFHQCNQNPFSHTIPVNSNLPPKNTDSTQTCSLSTYTEALDF